MKFLLNLIPNDIKKFLTSNQKSSRLLLDLLAHDNDLYVRYDVAENPNTSSKTLASLSYDSKIIRLRVALHLNTSSETLDELSRYLDNHTLVRVATHPNTTPETLEKISSYIGPYLLRNPKCLKYHKTFNHYQKYLNLL